MKTKKILHSLFLMLLLTALSSCGYHIGSIAPAGIKTVYIPMLENITHRQEITPDITDGIIKRFNTDGTVRVMDKDKADAILYGKISTYTTEALRFDDQDIGEEFRVIITVDLRLVKTDTGETIYSTKNIDGRATTEIILNQVEAERSILPDIIEDLSKNVVDSVLESAW